MKSLRNYLIAIMIALMLAGGIAVTLNTLYNATNAAGISFDDEHEFGEEHEDDDDEAGEFGSLASPILLMGIPALITIGVRNRQREMNRARRELVRGKRYNLT